MIASALLCCTGFSAGAADPRTNSWMTSFSGKYARVYLTDAAKGTDSAVTTWSRNTISQATPAYCGVQEIYSSANWVYLRTTGLGAHTMGPWYLNAARTTLFPNVPKNQKAFYRIPRNPTVPGSKTLTGGGAIGYFVDGVAMFDNRDAFYWNGAGEGNGSGFWNRDAFVNEGITFDPGQAHQQNTGVYHYHANPIALRYLLGDNVLFNAANKSYAENLTNTAPAHSPILGWVRDGYPVYGPYGYAIAGDANSGVRRMISGYVLRNGANGTDNLSTNGAARASIPAWAARLYAGTPIAGPTVSATYPFGRYLEDNAFLGDLTNSATAQKYQQGVDFDLDEYNGRFCKTPEFPEGTYAYFITINASGAPAMPYHIGRAFYGSPTGNTVASLAETVITNFVALDMRPEVARPSVNGNETVTLVWSSTEGASYQVEATPTLSNWTSRASGILAGGRTTQTNLPLANPTEFYRVSRTSLATHDPVK